MNLGVFNHRWWNEACNASGHEVVLLPVAQHSSGDAETGLNMRHFEMTAAGGFLLCYDQPELADHFVPEKECVVFRNERDLLEKIRYYLSHAEERTAIAQVWQRRTLAQHLYRHRVQTLLETAAVRRLPSHAQSAVR